MRRFWTKVHKTETCWLWIAGKNEAGYGWFTQNGRSCMAHRVSYALTGGSLLPGMTIDHLCRVRHCVNPAHLEQVTFDENTRRGEAGINERVKTHCPRGHAYDAANTYASTTGGQRRRHCRTCGRRAVRMHRLRKRDSHTRAVTHGR